MSKELWDHTRKTLPVGMYQVAIGVVVGLAAGTGALWLDESVDLAKGIGIAAGFSFVVGAWLGFNLGLSLNRGYTVWIAAIRQRVVAIESRMLAVLPANEGKGCGKRQVSLATHAVAGSIYANPFCCVVLVAKAITAALWTQLDYSGAIVILAAALGSLGVLLAAVVLQCLYLLHLQWMVVSLERQLDRTASIAPVTMRADVLDRNISRTERLVSRLAA